MQTPSLLTTISRKTRSITMILGSKLEGTGLGYTIRFSELRPKRGALLFSMSRRHRPMRKHGPLRLDLTGKMTLAEYTIRQRRMSEDVESRPQRLKAGTINSIYLGAWSRSILPRENRPQPGNLLPFWRIAPSLVNSFISPTAVHNSNTLKYRVISQALRLTRSEAFCICCPFGYFLTQLKVSDLNPVLVDR